MAINETHEGIDTRALTNSEIVEHTVQMDSLTPLEVELTLRLEEYIGLFGDYLTEV